MSRDRTAGPPNRSPGPLDIARAIPAGCRRARSQRAFLAALGADPRLAGLRADARRTVLELARIWARHADWHTMTSWCPRARMCAEVGSSRDPSRPLSVSTYKTARRQLEELGYLALLSQGWTSALRSGVLDDGSGVSAVFVLTMPRRKPRLAPPAEQSPVNRPLACPDVVGSKAPARAREARAGNPPPGDPWPRWLAPQNRTDALAAATVVRGRAGLLSQLSAEHWRAIIRPFAAAGYSPGDILQALDAEPGGRSHGYRTRVRHVAGWARHRLSLWLDPLGVPLPAPSQRREAERGRVRAEQSARRAERLRAAERRGDYAAGAAMARAQLARRQSPTERRSSSSVVPAISS